MLDPSALAAKIATQRMLPPSMENRLKEAELLFRLGQATLDEAEKRRHFEASSAIAAEVRATDPRNPQALLRWTAAAGMLASMDRNFKALRTVSEVEKTMLELKGIDPAYDSAVADRVLGRLYHTLPPLISIGSMSKAGRHLREAYRRFPGYPGNQAYLAAYLFEIGEKEEARRLAGLALVSNLESYPYDCPEWMKLSSRVIERTSPQRTP